jgi:hypothetical protein
MVMTMMTIDLHVVQKVNTGIRHKASVYQMNVQEE